VAAELKSLDAVDAPGGVLTACCPADGEHFGLAVTATIGPANGERGELFQFDVCSPSWLAAEDRPKGFAFQRVLVLDRWVPIVWNGRSQTSADTPRPTPG